MVARRTFDPKRGLATLLFLLLWLSSSVVLASPLGPAPAALQKRKPSFPSIDDCRAKFTAPPADKAMYFTSLKKYKDVQAAKKYANDHGLVHVSNSYPAQFTDAGQYDGTSEEKKAFQEAFSQVYAEGTSGIAYLYLDDNAMPGDESIFKNIELPALKAGGKVTKIIRFPPSSDDPTKSDNEFWSPAQEAATEIVVTAGVTGVGTETGLGVLPSLHD